MKWSPATVAEVPLGVVTVTSTWPADPADETAVTEVAEFTTTPVAAFAPKCTAVAPVRLVPVMVTLVPPAVGPLVGATEVTVGTAAASVVQVNPFESLALALKVSSEFQ